MGGSLLRREIPFRFERGGTPLPGRGNGLAGCRPERVIVVLSDDEDRHIR